VPAAACLLVQVAVAATVAVRRKVAGVGERARGGRPGGAAEEAEARQRRLSSRLPLVCGLEWSWLQRRCAEEQGGENGMRMSG
jgi:hypothetical protein